MTASHDSFLPRYCKKCRALVKSSAGIMGCGGKKEMTELPHDLETHMEVVARQQDEWRQVGEDLSRLSPGAPVTAFDVTSECDRRMAERGERRVTYEEMKAEFEDQ